MNPRAVRRLPGMKVLVGPLKFILPFGLWLFFSRTFFTGQATILGENYLHYSFLKFYLDNLRTGVFPLWNPYILWGIVNHTDIVAYNPFLPLWGLILVLNSLGIHFYYAYLATMIIYFFVGMLGFTFLAREVLKDKTAAYAAFLMMLFSSVSMPMFVNLIMLLIFIPGVWFFYFLLSFGREQKPFAFGGIIFCLMVILSTYLPFYFLTVLMFFILLAVLLWPGRSLIQLKAFFIFARRHVFLVLFACMALGLAAYPSYQTYQYSRDHQIVAPDRQSIGDNSDVFSKGVVLPNYYSAGGMSARMSPEDLYSNLDQIHYGNDGFFYVPLFCYLLILLGIFQKVTRRLVMLMGLCVFIFLMTISSTTPVHRFLYDHIFFFKLFRNLQYLVPYLAAVFILFAAEHLKMIWNKEDSLWHKPKLACIFVLGIHGLVAVFLLFQLRVIVSSYVNLILSAILFSILFVKSARWSHRLALTLLIICILIQPMEVLWHYNQGAGIMGSPINRAGLKVNRVVPRFSLTRRGSVIPDPGERVWDYVQWYRITMTDSPGFLAPGYGFPAYWVFYLSRAIDPPAYRNYVQYKLLLYDRAELLRAAELKPHIGRLTKSFRNLENLAFIAAEGLELAELQQLEHFFKPVSAAPRAEAIESEQDRFHIKGFDVNSLDLELNVMGDKILVYNDAYHYDWRAWVDGQQVPIYRTNLAFKGIIVPAGRHQVRFRFAPAGGTFLPWIILVVFYAWLGILTVAGIRRMRVC